MSVTLSTSNTREVKAIVGEPEVVEDMRGALEASRGVEEGAAWARLKENVTAFQALQAADGSVPDAADHAEAARLIGGVEAAIGQLHECFPHDAAYLDAVLVDLTRWRDGGFGVPDFHDSLVAFHPERARVDGLRHLVVFPMYTQNGSRERHFEAVLVEFIWPDFVAALEREYDNALFCSLRLVDFTPGYDTDSAVLFPETVAMRETPAFTWGAIFQDREAARYRRVIAAAAQITKLDLPPRVTRVLADQAEAEATFVMWDLLHDRTHMRGDLPFDPFMIRQRMPYFLYSLEELRCDLTAYRQCVELEKRLRARSAAGNTLDAVEQRTLECAGTVQDAVLLDRIFRFALTGSRIRNYDGLGGQLLFAWLHRHGVLHWTDTELTIDWDALPPCVIALADRIDDLYWRSIDRPKQSHWLAAHALISEVLEAHPASAWAAGLPRDVLLGAPKGYTDAVLDDEFPLSMFYEALGRKLRPVIDSTRGIRGSDD